METFLKKHSRAHKYLGLLSPREIDVIIARHVPRLRSIQIFNFDSKINQMWPEVADEYQENQDRIILDVKTELKKEFMKKIRLPKGSDGAIALDHYLHGI